MGGGGEREGGGVRYSKEEETMWVGGREQWQNGEGGVREGETSCLSSAPKHHILFPELEEQNFYFETTNWLAQTGFETSRRS
jgi:hypothetical protein